MIAYSIYTMAFVAFVLAHICLYLKFKKISRNKNAKIITDKLYEVTMYITRLIYIGLSVSTWVELPSNYFVSDNWKLPFVACVMPFMGICFKIMVQECSYAINDKIIVIGTKGIVSRDEIMIEKIKEYKHIKRAKVSIVESKTDINAKKYVMRTSLNNICLLKKA